MAKRKIIVLSLMFFCVLFFAAAGGYFLLQKDNFAEPEGDETAAAVLKVAGLDESGQRDPQALRAQFQRRVSVRQLNLDSGELLAPGKGSAAQKRCVSLPAAGDPAQIRQRCSLVDIYLVHDKNETIQQIILPVFGKGAKSMMYALVAIDTDGRTVKDLLYYRQNETPLLGARVEDPQWLRQWAGKKVRDDRGQPALKVTQNNGGRHDDYTVDGISGATLTSNGVEKSINYWMGPQGYGKFLQRIQQDPTKLSAEPAHY